ncbi:hypothetical protein HNP55_002736 [Paucibacter oligotrophus]|uniref:HNH nuclease domain-containing protein n=1 Tax=Roseateles oligotrophus TaxID=1769250 RepID=A0A840L7N4_9BURK|nr:HNH endonuclease signature motif containing protein [Roseateles oligotrophus]MBB4844200.1 hypothetical protein [Roseateles oligotrophus]
MTPNEDVAFTEFLRQKTAEAETLGYRPKLFKQMLGAQGGEATVRQLLAKGKPSEGFTRLWELGRLDLTVEALVVETKWRLFVDPILVQHAERLLTQSKYRFSPFNDPSSADGTTQAPASAVTSAAEQKPKPQDLMRSSRRKNTRSFSDFCASLGAPLANRADRWCGYNQERGFAVFTIWADRLRGDRYVLWDAALRINDRRVGAIEMSRVLRQVIAAGHAAYGIRCEPHDANATPRERGYFDDEHLLVLTLSEEASNVLAKVEGETPAADVVANRRGPMVPFQSAIDDLGAPPSGNAVPSRTAKNVGSGYRRDNAVRDYVVRRAQGHCEHCGARGFEMVDGTYYLEAHHVIALSAEGPDTVENVIALCPEHHREAHYGKDAEGLERAFLAKLRGRLSESPCLRSIEPSSNL